MDTVGDGGFGLLGIKKPFVLLGLTFGSPAVAALRRSTEIRYPVSGSFLPSDLFHRKLCHSFLHRYWPRVSLPMILCNFILPVSFLAPRPVLVVSLVVVTSLISYLTRHHHIGEISGSFPFPITPCSQNLQAFPGFLRSGVLAAAVFLTFIVFRSA